MSFGSNLRHIRLRKGLRLKDLADELDVSINYLSKLEQDNAKMYPDFLPRLCQALKINLIELYDKNQPNKK